MIILKFETAHRKIRRCSEYIAEESHQAQFLALDLICTSDIERILTLNQQDSILHTKLVVTFSHNFLFFIIFQFSLYLFFV